MPRDTIDAAMAELRVQGPLTDLRGAPALMSVDEARSIRSETIGFGSHAMTHASLPSLPAAEKAREIRNSIRACKQLTGDRPKTFAYPFGDFDTECMALVAKAGFACACTVEPRPVDPDDDPFALPRLRVGNWSWRQLRQKLADAAGE